MAEYQNVWEARAIDQEADMVLTPWGQRVAKALNAMEIIQAIELVLRLQVSRHDDSGDSHAVHERLHEKYQMYIKPDLERGYIFPLPYNLQLILAKMNCVNGLVDLAKGKSWELERTLVLPFRWRNERAALRYVQRWGSEYITRLETMAQQLSVVERRVELEREEQEGKRWERRPWNATD